MQNRYHGFKSSDGRSIITGSRSIDMLDDANSRLFISGGRTADHQIRNQAAGHNRSG
jgi:hypothetical protein